ncbi:MAG: MSMEG_4193 family putative phosphomutase [Candidatus Promineifilaceae bacterium]|nr:MSMEG_4193 family putative phosphomutase [Candidatus Promineifilaceae bacterium]
MAVILLVRHGQNEWVEKKRLAGWLPNVHLNAKGKEQAREAAERLSHLPIKSIYSSPVERCMETATYIAQELDLEIEQLEAIGEVRYGDWEGAEIEQLSKEKSWFAVQHFPSRFRFPQGEALRDVQSRAVSALETLSVRYEPHEMVVVVSHADLIKLVLAHYLGVHIDLFQRIVISPASISAIALMDNGLVRVLRVNDTGRLEAPAPEKEETEPGDNGSSDEKDGEEL